jgi:acetylornithine deacetylase
MWGLHGDAVALLSDLIGFPTVSSESNLDLIAYAQEHLDGIGIVSSVIHDAEGQKANLLARIGPEVAGGVVLSGHTDVVPADPEHWASPPYVAALRDAAIYGRGSADMKGFIACMLAMAPRFAAADLARPVHLALTFDEEVSGVGAPLLIEQLVAGPLPAVAIVGEPTEMAVVVANKGSYEYRTVFTGSEGHASSPALGVNAVEYAARFVAHLLSLGEELQTRTPPDSPFQPPESTISVGRIDGGTARNVIAGSCTVDWELRPVCRADAEHAVARVREVEAELRVQMREVSTEADVSTQVIGEVEALEPVEDSPAVALVESLLDLPSREVMPFGSEAGFYQRAGISTVVCGPGSIGVAHQPDEHVSLEQLESCLAMLERLVVHLS